MNDSFSQVNDEKAFLSGTYSKKNILTNNIKSITESFRVEDGEKSNNIYYFSKNGILEKVNTIDKKGNETAAKFFQFNSQGDLVRIITTSKNTGAFDTLHFYKEYIGNNLVKEILPYSNVTIHYYYDYKNRRTRSENEYNYGSYELGRRVVTNVYDDSDRIVHVTDCIYNRKMDSIIQWMSDRIIKYDQRKIIKIAEKINGKEFLQNRGDIEYSYNNKDCIISIISDAVASEYYSYEDSDKLTSKTTVMPKEFDTGSLKIYHDYYYVYWK